MIVKGHQELGSLGEETEGGENGQKLQIQDPRYGNNTPP